MVPKPPKPVNFDFSKIEAKGIAQGPKPVVCPENCIFGYKGCQYDLHSLSKVVSAVGDFIVEI